MKMLPEEYKVVTATVDEHAGEIGTIYQACNFHYIGSMRENNPNGVAMKMIVLALRLTANYIQQDLCVKRLEVRKKTIFCDVFLMQNLCRKHLKKDIFIFRNKKEKIL